MNHLSRPVTRGAQGGWIPLKIFATLEKCVGHALKLLDIIQKSWVLLRKLFHPNVPSWLRACLSVVLYLLDKNVSIDDPEVNCLTNTKACLSSHKKSINQMQFVVKWWNMKDGENILQLAVGPPLNASANWWRLHSFTSALWPFTLMGNDFFLDAATNLK